MSEHWILSRHNTSIAKRLLVLRDRQRCVVAWERAVAPDRRVTLNKTLDTLLLSIQIHYPWYSPMIPFQYQVHSSHPSPETCHFLILIPELPVFGYWTLDVWRWCVFPATQPTQPANNFLLVCLFSYLHFPAPSHTGGRPIFWLIPPRPRSEVISCFSWLTEFEILSKVSCWHVNMVTIIRAGDAPQTSDRGVVAGQGRGRGRGRGQCGPGPWASRGGRALLLASRLSGDRRREEETWGPETSLRRLKVCYHHLKHHLHIVFWNIRYLRKFQF